MQDAASISQLPRSAVPVASSGILILSFELLCNLNYSRKPVPKLAPLRHLFLFPLLLAVVLFTNHWSADFTDKLASTESNVHFLI